jgi:hypothetical protein
MNDRDPILALVGEIHDGLKAVAKIEGFLVEYEETSIRGKRPGVEQALALSQALGNYYTCLATVFFRISQFFENSLPSARWHQALLERMTFEIPETRPAVISHSTQQGLQELLRFRHFSRYYYAFDYDWDKLRFLLLKFNQVRVAVVDELEGFTQTLRQVAE